MSSEKTADETKTSNEMPKGCRGCLFPSLIVVGLLTWGIIALLTDNRPPPPEVPESVISGAIDFITEEPGVRDAAISIQDRTISMAVQVGAGREDSHNRSLANTFIRHFAYLAALSEETWDGPRGDHLGGKWHDYTLHITIGAGPENIFL